MFTNNIGDARRLYAVENGGFTQQDAASALGMSISTYRNYEQGRTDPSLEMLRRIAELFNVSVDYLVGLPDRSPECLTEGERELLSLYRKSNDAGKRAIIASSYGISSIYVEL